MIDSCDRHALQISAETFSKPHPYLMKCNVYVLIIDRVIHHVDLDGAPLLILANKQDREVR